MARPSGQMTHRRRQVLAALLALREAGVPVRPSEVARRCGMGNWRNAARVMRDVERLGFAGGVE